MCRLLLLILLVIAPLRAEPIPPELRAALDALQTDAPRGWGFIQTSEGENHRRVEKYHPLGPEPARWTLLELDGRAPTEAEITDYRKKQTLRAGGQRAPNVKDQILPESAEQLSETATESVWRFALKPGSDDDTWAPHMAATFTLHRPSRTISRVELGSLGPFSPMFLTNVAEARTVMEYALPEGDTPALLQRITVRVRGKAWFFRSLDSDLVVTYSDYQYAGKR
ncbi:MAG TPA: hypothetical protein VHF69_12695 [Candidatus Synoicihabitans sp.]|nr:hypothetical protein [Candidatus Synoicihabitans sp.]